MAQIFGQNLSGYLSGYWRIWLEISINEKSFAGKFYAFVLWIHFVKYENACGLLGASMSGLDEIALQFFNLPGSLVWPSMV